MFALEEAAPVTATPIVLNILCYFVSLYFMDGAPNERDLIAIGAQHGPLAWHGEPWRFITAMFLHGSFSHLLGNLIALYAAGPIAERVFGSRRCAVIYLLSGLAGNVVSACWHPLIASVGASGAIMGVFGALAAFVVVAPRELAFPQHMRLAAGLISVLTQTLFYGYFTPYIDNAGHVGGLLAGAGAAAPLVRRLEGSARIARHPALLLKVTAAICLALAVFAALLAPWR